MYKIITTLEDMKSLQPGWNYLGQGFSSPMLQFDWFYHCAKIFYKEKQLRIFVIYHDDVIIAIAPMAQVSYLFSQWLEILGSAKLYEPCGLLYRDQAALEELIKVVLAFKLPINLQRINKASLIAESAFSTKELLFKRLVRPSASSYYLDAENNWELFNKKIGKNWRADFRNKANRAKRSGKVEIQHIKPTEDDFQQYFSAAVEIESRSWKAKQGSALAENALLYQFFYAYFFTVAAQGKFHLDFYSIDKNKIAVHMSVEHGARIWSFKIGYDESYSRLSPGMQLISSVIQESFSKNQAYEFLGSTESWQTAWPVMEHEYCSVIIYPFSLSGVFGFLDTVCSVTIGKARHYLQLLFRTQKN